MKIWLTQNDRAFFLETSPIAKGNTASLRRLLPKAIRLRASAIGRGQYAAAIFFCVHSGLFVPKCISHGICPPENSVESVYNLNLEACFC